MHQIEPKGWIRVSDIRAGRVDVLYDENLEQSGARIDPPILRPPSPDPLASQGATRDRLHHKIAPEFWGVEGGFDPEHFWRIHDRIPFYEVVIGSFEAEIVPGFMTPVWGYNRQVPGPTFVETVNRPLVVRFINELPTEVSIHLHGGHTPPHSDGHPAFLVCPEGGFRDYFYSNGVPKVPTADPLRDESSWDWSESASTMWYHDHANDITAHNALMGLAGFFLVTDAWERFLVRHGILPAPDYDQTDRSRDIPLVLGDRCLCKPQTGNTAYIHFDPFDHNGYLGNIPVCNGMAFPRLRVKAQKYRLRFLNAALARVHLLEVWDTGKFFDEQEPIPDDLFENAQADGLPYRVPSPWSRIGKDSWLTERPVEDHSILLGMANRADVMIDFKALLNRTPGRKKGTFFLVNVCDQRNGRGPGHGDNGLAAEDGATGNTQPRGNLFSVPRLDDPRRRSLTVDGGPQWSALKILRIDVEDDGTTDLCTFTSDLSSLKTLLERAEVQAEINAIPELAGQAGVHLRKHDDLAARLLRHQIEALPRRIFEFERGKGAWRISQRFFDEHRTDAPMVLGSLEVWTLVNRSGGWWHPIHIHLESHQQVEVKFDGVFRSRWDMNGKLRNDADPDNLQAHDRYKHDTALLGPNTSITILMRFRTFLGPFVFHCHNLNHEDMRMMTNFDPRLESLGTAAIAENGPLPHGTPMQQPMKPEDLLQQQLQGKLHPVPAPARVQQFFGDECE